MNKIYKLIWSKTKNCLVVASELAKGYGKNKSRIKNSLLAIFVMSALLAGGVADVQALTQQEKEEVKNEVAKYLLDKIAHGGEISGVDATRGPTNFPDAIANRIFYYNDISSKIGEKLKKDGLTLRYFGVRPDYIEPSRDYLERYANKDWTNVDNDGAFGAHSMALGYRAFSEAKHGVAIGRSALAGGSLWKGDYGGDGGVAIGNHAWALGDKSVSVGNAARAVHKGIAIGIQAEAGLDENDNTTDWSTAPGFTPKQGKSIQYDPKTKLPYVTSDIRDKMGAIAIGIDAKAHGNHSTAMGVGAKAKSRYAWSFGYSSEASGVGSIAFGSRATAKGTNAIAIGSGNYDQPNGGAQAYSEDTIAIGRGAKAGNEDDTEIASNTVAIGANAKAVRVYTGKKINDAVLIGANTQVTRERGTAVGANAYVDGASGAAFGDNASVIADEGLAIGKNAKVAYNSAKSIAIGSGAEVKNENAKPSEQAVAIGTGVVVGGNSSDAIAIGTGAKTQEGAQRSIAIGKGAIVKSYDSVVIGTNASAQWYNAVAIGNGAQATLSDGIALGSDSKTTVSSGYKGYDPYKNAFNIDAHPGAAWESTKAALSVGDVENNITRQITSVAAGRKDTDAVNVAQLKKLRDYTDTKMNIDLGNITPKGIDKVKDWAQEAIAVKSMNNDYLGIQVANSASSPNKMTYYLSPTQKFFDKMKTIDKLDRRTSELEEGWDLKLTTEKNDDAGAVQTLDVVEFGVANADSGLTVTRETTDAETEDLWGATKPIKKYTIKFGIDSGKLVENINKTDTAVTNISAKFSVAGKDSANADTTKAVNLTKDSNNTIKYLGTKDETVVTVGGEDNAPSVTVGLAEAFKNKVTANEGNITTNKNAIAGLTPKVTDNTTNITKLQAGFTVKDGGTGKADVALGGDTKQEVTFKADVDKTTEATANGSSLTSSVDKDRKVTYTLNMKQLKKDLGITEGPDGVMSSWKLKVKEETTPQEIKNGEAVTFDVAAADKGLTVTRDGKTIKYGIEGSKINLAGNTSITNLSNEIEKSKIHYFSVKSDDSSKPDGTNWKNDGATGDKAIAIGQKAGATGTSDIAIGTEAKATGGWGVAIGQAAKAKASTAVAMAYGAEAKGKNSLAIGIMSEARTDDSTAYGREAKALGEVALAVGMRAKAEGDHSAVFGAEATTDSTAWNGTAIGRGAYIGKQAPDGTVPNIGVSDNYYTPVDDDTVVEPGKETKNSTAVGFGAKSFGYQNTAVGAGAEAFDTNTVAVGVLSKAIGNYANALGKQARAEGMNSTAIGHFARALGESSMALGDYAITSTLDGTGKVNHSVALGSHARVAADNSLALGNNSLANIADDVKTEAYLSKETFKKENGVVSVGNKEYTVGNEKIKQNYRRITNVAGGADDNDAVNVAQLKALEGKVTTNAGDITTLKEGWTLADAKTGKKVVKAKDTVKVTGDDYITATVDNDGLKLGMDETKLNKQINNQIDNSTTVTNKMNSWVLKAATTDKDPAAKGQTIDNTNNVATFDATGKGLTVTRDGSTIKYGIDGSAIDIANNQSITNLGKRIDNLDPIHYFSVKSDDSANPDGTNYKNDGATGKNAIAIGKDAKAERESSVVIGLKASSGNAANDGVAVGSRASVTGFGGVAIGRESSAEGQETVAIGTGAKGVLNRTVAIGGYANADGFGAVAIGRDSSSKERGVALGNSSFSHAYSVGVGEKAIAEAPYSVAVGDLTGSYAMGAVTLGNKTRAFGDSSVAIGNQARVSGKGITPEEYKALPEADQKLYRLYEAVYHNYDDPSKPIVDRKYYKVIDAHDWRAENHYNSIAIGTTSFVEAKEAIGIGAGTRINGDRGVALGYAAVSEEKGTALGAGAQAKANAGVALGEGAVADTAAEVAGYDPKTGKASTETTPTWKSVKGAVSVGNADATRQITNLAAGSADTDAVNVAQLKALEGKVTTNTGDITTLKKGWTLADGNTGTRTVKAEDTVKVTGDNYITATVDNDGLKLGMDETKLNKQINNQIDNSTTVTNKMNSWVLKAATTDKDPAAKGQTIDNDNKVATFDVEKEEQGLTVARDGATIKYGVDKAKLAKHITGDVITNINDGSTAVTNISSKFSVTDGTNTKAVNLGKDKNNNVKFLGTTDETVVTVGGDDDAPTVTVGLDAKFKKQVTDNKTAIGENKTAIGENKTAIGENKTAIAENKTAIGENKTAIGENKTAIGENKTAIAENKTAIGENKTAIAENKTAIGENKTAIGENKTAIGENKTAIAENKTAIGENKTAIGENKTAIGENKTAIGENKTAIAENKTAIGENKTAIAENKTAIGENKTAIAENKTAIGENKTAIGENKTAIGENKTAIEKNTKAIAGKMTSWKLKAKGVEGEQEIKDGNEVTFDVAEKDKGLTVTREGSIIKYGIDGKAIDISENKTVNELKEEIENSKTTVKAGDGEKNISVAKTDGKNEYTLTLAKDLKDLDSVSATTVNAGTVKASDKITVGEGDTVTIDKDGLTIKDGPSVTTKGITNVKDGKNDTDAVNVRQLNALANQSNQNIVILGGKVIEVNNRVNRVGAGAASLAALHPLDFDPDDKWDFAAGYGNYKGANAVAIGAYYRPNEDTMFSVGGSFGGGENMVNAGVSVKLGQGNHVTTSRVAMAKEIKDLRAEVEVLRQAVTGIGQGQTPDPVKMKLFPDIAKNHWAYEAVEELTKQGLLEGYPDGTFGGDRMMTRYEFAEIVYRAMQKGLNVNEKLVQEFEPELERFRIDVITKDKDGNPVIERIRVNEKKKAK